MASRNDTASPSEVANDRVSPTTTVETLATTEFTAESCKESGKVDPAADEPKSNPVPDDDQPPPDSLRRSSRQFSKSLRVPGRVVCRSDGGLGRKRLVPSKMTTEPSRQNPKRKASEPAKLRNGLPSDLLAEALRPLSSEEIEEWEGWVELESDPAFFNIILRDLGVSNVKARELFSVDEDSISFLPKPVFGLIFLFQYHPGLDETQDEDDPDCDLWFANQTTHNACATVSLLNIILNVPQVQLGPSLASFKDSTNTLSTALRGHRLSSDPFIRRIHNSFTRRMDHLDTDLALENEFNEPRPKKAKSGGKKGVKGGPKAKRKAIEDFAFHFIGYVERDGHVWELDGLKTKPHRLGPVASDDWTSVVRPQIAMRMCQYEESQLSFNLIALCQNPLMSHSRKIAEGIASLRHLKLVADLKEGVGDWMPEDSVISQADKPEYLAGFGLAPEAVLKAEIPTWVREQVSQIDKTEKAAQLHKDLEVDAKVTMGEYRAELIEMAQDEQRVKGRRKDYGPALHKWVSKLAENGALEDLITSSRA